jgi:hypothetical protein
MIGMASPINPLLLQIRRYGARTLEVDGFVKTGERP